MAAGMTVSVDVAALATAALKQAKPEAMVKAAATAIEPRMSGR
ncbi:hypothetical protein ABT187_33090 [Streptomyces sp. NPDC001817]